ncbi:EcsC family protein [Luteimonas kalidii]|uniref:EcsC family protein n=1 Tax=Luteimonas kalidii TaxID=3042025 RepID=A0ABT6JXL1_9GAMM|nr:EcsC family protein [Luteimonas kalidii]MDH5835212.1 EcsC family protein [Luteimonas kalidii]
MTGLRPLPVADTRTHDLDPAAFEELRRARELLETPGIAAQLANAVGAPLEYVVTRRLPKAVTGLVNTLVRKALGQALRAAVATLRGEAAPALRTRVHTFAAAASGAVGGAFGLAGLAVELPVTTTLILRSIAEIARAEGEPLDDPATTLACFEVLTMGGRAASDDGAESGYFAARAVLAQQVAAAAEYVAVHGLVGKGGPLIVQLLSAVSARFSVNVSQKLALQAVPLVGAATGAALNTLFMRHFQAMARGHFTVRRLERTYGATRVRAAYLALGAGLDDADPQPARASR